MDQRMVYMTATTIEEARKIGADLIDRRLAACVNVIDGMRSLYHWQGKVEEGTEVILLAKTRAPLVEALTERVKALHSYTCPCVVALPIDGGNPEFLDWISAETEAAAAAS